MKFSAGDFSKACSVFRAARQLFALSLCAMGCAQPYGTLDHLDIPDAHRQVILVTTESWDASSGTLQLYSRTNGGWVSSGKSIDVMVGRNGLAWGQGLHATNMPEKVEGDGRAPAGIFELGHAFGYERTGVIHTTLPYRQATSRDYWVDDVESAAYNQWVTIPESAENDPGQRWGSFERMKREDYLYELGIIVKHNMSPIIKGKGSAIFMHVWREPTVPTAGCTAMDKDDLMKVMQWLDPQQQPLLIQVPDAGLHELKFSFQ